MILQLSYEDGTIVLVTIEALQYVDLRVCAYIFSCLL